MTAPARIPEGLTDPDAIDAWLEARDARTFQTSADLDALDADVMAAVPCHRFNPDAVTDSNKVDRIRARRAYDALPLWERIYTRLRGETPAGLIDRHPLTGLVNR